MIKKFIVLSTFSFLFLGGNGLFANDFSDCFEDEQNKAKSSGASDIVAAEKANQICSQQVAPIRDKIRAKEQKSRFIIEVIPSFGNVNVEKKEEFYNNPNCTDCSLIDNTTSYSASDVGFGIGLQFKKNHQISLESYAWKTGDSEVKNQLLAYNYSFANDNYIIGVNAGSGETTETGRKGSLLGWRFGYQKIFNDNFRLSINFLQTEFSYTSEGQTLCLYPLPLHRFSTCYNYSTFIETRVIFTGFLLKLSYLF